MIREQERIKATNEGRVPGAWCKMTACTKVRSEDVKTRGGFRMVSELQPA